MEEARAVMDRQESVTMDGSTLNINYSDRVPKKSKIHILPSWLVIKLSMLHEISVCSYCTVYPGIEIVTLWHAVVLLSDNYI